jgi:polysaccharide pyruvyl transferase WcaK-like protein
VIGIGVMGYAGKYTEERSSNTAHMTYLQTLAETAKRLLARGYSIRVLSGDLADECARQTFVRLLRQHLPMRDHQRIIDEPIYSVDDLLSQIVATDAVVATRYHNVLLSLLCEKPVISVSFHHKCESLMVTMGMSDYCLRIDGLEPDRLIQTFCRLEANADALKLMIRERTNGFRGALDQQYQWLFNGMQHRPTLPKHPQAQARRRGVPFKPGSNLSLISRGSCVHDQVVREGQRPVPAAMLDL